MSRRFLAFALTLTLVVAGCSNDSDSDDGGSDAGTDETTTTTPIDSPVAVADELEGPISGGTYGIAYLAMPEGWEDEFGYTEEEYFISGDAVAYPSADPLTADGAWSVAATSATSPYTTRFIVRRPADDDDFNGTVVVEWLNVSAGRDSDPDFGFLAEELMTEGYAYVGVSAQRTGVEPGGLGLEIPGVPPEALAPLKTWDPERYGDLAHPGDEWSYDIFSQAARTVLETGEGTPLGSLQVDHLIAAGESQSAARMVTYVNAVQPVTRLFDGFLVHSRGTTAAPLGDDPAQAPPPATQIRDDIEVPVFQFQTETDLDFLRFAEARQDDAELLVTWEVAGTAHADRSTLDYGVLAGRRWTDASVDLATACGQVNEGPQQQVVQTAIAALANWVATGERPPESPRIDLDADGEIARDADGIATGGIRTPAVDAPVSVLTGANPSPDIICVLFGGTTPFTPEQLADRYADSDDYVAQVEASAAQAVEDGFLLQRHADDMVTAAEEVEIG